MLINSIKKDHQLVHSKFWPYLDRFISRSVSNSLQCFIAKRDLEITYSEVLHMQLAKSLQAGLRKKKG